MAKDRVVARPESPFARTTETKRRKKSSSKRGINRQSVSEDRRKKGEAYGFDGGKKVKGRKRHIIVDSQGLLLTVLVSEANMPERLGAIAALMELPEDELAQLDLIWVDQGYRGDNFARVVKQVCGAEVEVSIKTEKEFKIMPRRWVVERTFAWCNQYRRLSKDYEKLPEVSEALIYSVMCCLMLRRLASATLTSIL